MRGPTCLRIVWCAHVLVYSVSNALKSSGIEVKPTLWRMWRWYPAIPDGSIRLIPLYSSYTYSPTAERVCHVMCAEFAHAVRKMPVVDHLRFAAGLPTW